MTDSDTRPVAIIRAGPSGLAAARNLDRQGVDWVGFELAGDVGGLWNVDAADTRHCETRSAATPRSCASNRSGRG